MAADCSDSLAAQIVCCQADNGLTHGELTPSLFTVQLLAVLVGFLFDSIVAHVLVETALSSHDCAFFLYFFYFSFQWEFPVSFCSVYPPGFSLLRTLGLVFIHLMCSHSLHFAEHP